MPASPGALTAAQVQHTLAVLRDDRRRAELIGDLEAIAQTLPDTPNATTPAASESTTVTTPAASASASSSLTDDGLARRLLAESSTGLQAAGKELADAVKAVNDLPDLASWLSVQVSDPRARARVVDALWRMGVVFGGALAAEWIAIWLLRRPRAALAR